MTRKTRPRAIIHLLLAIASIDILVQTGLSQVIGNVPKHLRFDGNIDEWWDEPLSFTRFGNQFFPLWVAQTPEGLVFAGTTSYLQLASTKEQLATAGRLELWLSVIDEVQMPPVSWSGDNATEAEICDPKEGQAKSTCVQWYRDSSRRQAWPAGLRVFG